MRTIPLILFVVSIAVSSPANAQTDGEPVSLGTYRVIHSVILDEDRPLQVYLPRGYDESTVGYPVVYLLYSDLVELYYARAIHDLALLSIDRIPPVILVGVANTQRYRDLLPWARPGGRGGQADQFLEFVAHELIPFVESEYRTKEYRILIGPQAAAVFGAYALLESPATFDALILNNPCTIDTEERALCPRIAPLAQTIEGRKYLSVTTNETDLSPSRHALEQLEQTLERVENRNFHWRIEIDDATGVFIPPMGLAPALMDLFDSYPFPPDHTVSGLVDIQAHYDGLSKLYGFTVDPPDFVLARASDQLSDAGSYEAALEVLLHLNGLYPASMNGLWRLANLYRQLADTAQAVTYYEACLSRDPNMAPAREWLERLTGEKQ